MSFKSTLWLTGILTALAPATLPAQVQTIAVNPTVDTFIAIRGDGINSQGPVNGGHGRLEIQLGDWVGGYRQIMVTRLNLRIPDFNLGDRAFFREVGIQLRGGLSSWARDISTPAEMATGRQNYEVNIPHDDIHTTGDPLFLGAALVSEDEDPDSLKAWSTDDRVAERIWGYINLSSRRYFLRLKFVGTIPAPWWAVWADDLKRVFWISVHGEIPESHYMKEPSIVIMPDPVVVPPSDDPAFEPPPPPGDPFPPRSPVNPR